MTKRVFAPVCPDERGVQSFQESHTNFTGDSATDKVLTPKLEQFVFHIDTSCQERMATLRAVFESLPRQISIIDTPDMAAANTQVIILHTSPVESVALALQAGQNVTMAISDWRSRAQALLTFFRKNRQCSLIIEDTAFLSDPQKLLESLGLKLPDEVTKKFALRPNAIFRILATEALRHDMLAGALAEELEASATINASDQSEADIEMAHECYVKDCAELASLRSAQAEAALEKVDHDTVLRELFTLQGKLRSSQQSAERLDQQLQQLRDAQARALNESEAKVKTLSNQVNKLFIELENTKTDSESRNAEIGRIRASKSFRMTQPIRSLHSVLRRRR